MGDSRYAPASDVRQWALETGLDVKPTKGRLPRAVIDEFNAEHPHRPYVEGLPPHEQDAVRRARRDLAGEP